MLPRTQVDIDAVLRECSSIDIQQIKIPSFNRPEIGAFVWRV